MFHKWFRQTQHNLPASGMEIELPVATEWYDLVQRADAMADAIDRHLEHESTLQGRDLSPATLCPEQKANLASDLAYLCR